MTTRTEPIPDELAGHGLLRLMGVGLLAWALSALGILAWFYATVPDSGLMGVAMPFYSWGRGFLPGGVVLALYGLLQWGRGRLRGLTVLAAIVAYGLPVLAAALVNAAFLALQPTAVTYSDLPLMVGAFAGPIAFLLYGAGLVVAFASRARRLRGVLVRMLAPPIAGVVVTVVALTIFTLTSSHWRHRDDLALDVARVEWHAPGLAIEAQVNARNSHRVVMHAFYRDRHEGGGRSTPVEQVRIDGSTHADWTRRPLELQAGHRYDLRLQWGGMRFLGSAQEREVVLRFVRAPDYHGGELIREFRIDAEPDAASVAALERRLEPVRREGGTGYENALGEMVIAPRFDWAGEFHEGRARVRINGRFGFIDTAGELVIPARYLNATRFADGRAGVRGRDGAGYIDKEGNLVIPLRFDNTEAFSEGLARVGIDGRQGFIDRSGKLVIDPRWERARDFHRGLAAVQDGEHWGFIDRSGTLVIEHRFDALNCCSEGWRVMRDGEWGRIEK